MNSSGLAALLGTDATESGTGHLQHRSVHTIAPNRTCTPLAGMYLLDGSQLSHCPVQRSGIHAAVNMGVSHLNKHNVGRESAAGPTPMRSG